jgi:hypothetical protein
MNISTSELIDNALSDIYEVQDASDQATGDLVNLIGKAVASMEAIVDKQDSLLEEWK